MPWLSFRYTAKGSQQTFFSHQDSSLIYYFRSSQGSLINRVQPASDPGWKGRENQKHCSTLQMALTQGHEGKDALETAG